MGSSHIKDNANPVQSLQGIVRIANQLLLLVDGAGVLADAGALAGALEEAPEALAALPSALLFSVLAGSDEPPLPEVSDCFESVFLTGAVVLLPPLLKSVTYQPPPFN